MKRRRFLAVCALTLVPSGAGVAACKDTTKVSIARASEHVAFLVETTTKDVDEVRHGLPDGAVQLAESLKKDPALTKDPNALHDALELTRRKVQDLRMAKSTFFAIADPGGTVLRNDQDQDRMVGRPLFASFPVLPAAAKKYVETTGSMPEAAGVRAPRPDGQWIAGTPVTVDGETKALYVTGWSWASYAYRLELALRGKVRSELTEQKTGKEPLVYVFMVVGNAVYGAPVTPEVSAKAIADLDPLAKVKGSDVFTSPIEITGRSFGLAVRRAPAFGADVGIAILRSET